VRWFASDLHLGHENIIGLADRPFSSIDKMNSTLTFNFLSVMRRGDLLYLLGDTFLDKKVGGAFLRAVRDLGVRIHFLKGNHDGVSTRWLCDNGCKTVDTINDVKVDGQKITLCHFPMVSWNFSREGSWHLHGHWHVNTPRKEMKGKILNVNVEFHDFYPWSFDEVKTHMDGCSNNWDYTV